MIRKGLMWSAVALLLMLGVVLWASGNLPSGNQIPVHFDATGTPDRYGTKAEAMLGLWIIWGTTVFTVILLAVLPRLMPRKANFEKSAKAYFACWMGMLVLMMGITSLVAWMMVKAGNDGAIGARPIQFILFGTAALYILIGNYLPKTRANWLIGVRTPWTLSSDMSWEKTHRLAGILFFGTGILTALAALLLPVDYALAISVGGILLAAVIAIIYSWWVWRTASDREESSRFVE